MFPPHPEPLKNPPVSKAPDAKPEPVAPKQYVEACDFHTKPAPATVTRDATASKRQLEAAVANMHKAGSAKTTSEQNQLIGQSIDELNEALRKDPYNSSATLALALAYDRVLYKGCAIALLTRLGKLADRYQSEAEPVIDDIVANRIWFADYRQDALRAVGRP